MKLTFSVAQDLGGNTIRMLQFPSQLKIRHQIGQTRWVVPFIAACISL